MAESIPPRLPDAGDGSPTAALTDRHVGVLLGVLLDGLRVPGFAEVSERQPPVAVVSVWRRWFPQALFEVDYLAVEHAEIYVG